MTLSIVAILLLLVLSAFFSGAETALTAASRPLMHQLAQNGDVRAQTVNRVRDHKERLIGALLVGNNVVNILASSLATGVLIAAFGNAGVAYATAVMTVLVLVFGEILPKTYAFHNANQAARLIAPLVEPLVRLLSPITHALSLIVRVILRLFGIDIYSDEALRASSAELRGAIELHANGDAHAVRRERAMLRSVLDLAEVQVTEIMIHRRNVTTIEAGTTIEEVMRQVLESPHSRFPVWRDNPDNIIGVLHAKALLRAALEAGPDWKGLNPVALATQPWFIPEYTLLLDQLNAFRERREHFALVVDEYGSLLGIVTLEDILEEIVGDLSDRHGEAVRGVRPQADGSYIVLGTVTIRDLNREFEWSLPDEEASTIAGLVLHESRRIPDVGQAFIFHGFRFEILRRQRHQITQIRITPPPELRAPRAKS